MGGVQDTVRGEAISKDGKTYNEVYVQAKARQKKHEGNFYGEHMCRVRPRLVRARTCAGCGHLIGVVRRISRFVTGAVKAVALDTAHEGRNDCRVMLIWLWRAEGSGPALWARTRKAVPC